MSYKEKVITVEQALDMIRPDMNVVTGLGAGEAQLIMNNIHTIADRVKNVTITNCLSMAHGDFLGEEYAESFNIDGWFFSPPLRKAFKNGNISFIPNHLHLAGWKRLDHVTPDIFVGTATMPDEHGFISLSTSNTYESR